MRTGSQQRRAVAGYVFFGLLGAFAVGLDVGRGGFDHTTVFAIVGALACGAIAVFVAGPPPR